MRIDSNKLRSGIDHVCNDCGKAALKLPENKHKKQFEVSTFYTRVCDVCQERKPVTETRDFMFPVFEVLDGTNMQS